jgi:reticulon-1
MSDHHENYDEQNHENNDNLNQEPTSSSDDHQNQQQHVPPSAPTHDDNGYIVVPPTPQTSVDSSHLPHDKPSSDHFLSKESQEEISKVLVDISNETNSVLLGNMKPSNTVLAEADSSSSSSSSSAKSKKESSSSSAGCSLCPYYLLACNYVTKVQIPPKVQDLLLWRDPKVTGAVFGSAFVLLLSLSLFSLLTVVSSLSLLALTVVGSYRFYLAVLFRIKGVQDPTFEKLSQFNLSLPNDKVKQLANLLETDINRLLNQAKSVVLWDNVMQSSIAYLGLYVVYCVGSVFNTLTLLILGLVSVFTLPKVYQVYKVPIDQGIEQATASVHLVVRQAMAKVLFLNQKKKTQ